MISLIISADQKSDIILESVNSDASAFSRTSRTEISTCSAAAVKGRATVGV